MILVDTSVWIESFRRGGRRLEDLVPLDEVVTCLPVVQEVLQGFADERAFHVAREAMFALPQVDSPLSAEIFEEAVELHRAARRRGLTLRSSIDCLIASCALRHDLEIVHRDRNYEALARVSRLRERNVR